MLEKLKEEVYRANMLLPQNHLVIFTWGNVSGINRESGLVVIKPSGVPYEQLSADSMVVVDLDGNVVEGGFRPSSDTPTHLELYRAFHGIGGITHTHSHWATVWAQAGKGIPALGTTHADYFDGQIPCTRPMTPAEIKQDYEKNTGLVIAEAFRAIDPMRLPAALVHSHGPFAWGKSPEKSVECSIVLETVAEYAFHTMELFQGDAAAMQPELLRKHFDRKHGKNAYYGQIGR